MATKKEVVEAVTHESLMTNIEKAEIALAEAKQAYKDFCKEKPLEAPKQMSVHELRKANQKVSK